MQRLNVPGETFCSMLNLDPKSSYQSDYPNLPKRKRGPINNRTNLHLTSMSVNIGPAVAVAGCWENI